MRLYLRASETQPGLSWRLLAWCLEHGGHEFFLRRMSLEGRPQPNIDRVDALLAPYRLRPAMRPRTVVYRGQPDREVTELWALSAASMNVLRNVLPDGLFAPPTYDEDGWLEEPTVYRDGLLLLGIVSHEDEGFVDVTQRERAEIESLGVTLHPAGIWI